MSELIVLGLGRGGRAGKSWEELIDFGLGRGEL